MEGKSIIEGLFLVFGGGGRSCTPLRGAIHYNGGGGAMPAFSAPVWRRKRLAMKTNFPYPLAHPFAASTKSKAYAQASQGREIEVQPAACILHRQSQKNNPSVRCVQILAEFYGKNPARISRSGCFGVAGIRAAEGCFCVAKGKRKNDEKP